MKIKEKLISAVAEGVAFVILVILALACEAWLFGFAYDRVVPMAAPGLVTSGYVPASMPFSQSFALMVMLGAAGRVFNRKDTKE